MTKAKNKAEIGNGVEAMIVWELRLRGDVNETHQGGNASDVLFHRLKAQGYPRSFQSFSTAVSNLTKTGQLKVLKHATVRHAIRLGTINEWPPNPFENMKPPKSTMIDLTVEPPTASLLNGHADLSITQRLQLIEELCASVRSDMEQYKSGVLAGL